MSERFQIGEQIFTVTVAARRPVLRLEIDGRSVEVLEFRIDRDGMGIVQVDGHAIPFRRAVEHDRIHLEMAGQDYSIGVLGSRDDGTNSAARDGAVHAPMPGVVVEVFCEPGQTVAQGDPLMTIESMKLQSELRAPCGGTIASVDIDVGGAFDRDARLISFEPQISADDAQ